jgi:RNA polymerase sigma-70 factor, ECF subfamily
MRASRPESAAFDELVARYRPEIQLHCYRLLGSLHDAEDLTQETLLQAWRGLAGFEGRSSVRTWLYRIATNSCLRALARRSGRRRALPEAVAAPVAFAPLGRPDAESRWLDPYPDAALAGLPDGHPGPAARYELHESVRLAFVAAIQILPPRQRAALLLRDVLGFSAAETAALLDATLPSVNSALQRARATLSARPPDSDALGGRLTDARQQSLLERYQRAWREADVDGLVALLRDDVVWSMPPWRQWYVGRAPVRAFLAWALPPDGSRRHRLVPTAANGQPAFGHYRAAVETATWQAFAIQVLVIHGAQIASITHFVNPVLFEAFGLPTVTDEFGSAAVSVKVG